MKLRLLNDLFRFYGISIIFGYLKPNPVLKYIFVWFDLVWFGLVWIYGISTILGNLMQIVFIHCDGPVAAIGLIYRKIRTAIQGPEVRQTIGGFSSPSNSDEPIEKGQRS